MVEQNVVASSFFTDYHVGHSSNIFGVCGCGQGSTVDISGGAMSVLEITEDTRKDLASKNAFKGQEGMTSILPVTITTAEELRLFEQEDREALLRRSAFSSVSNQIGLEENKRLPSISRTVGLISFAISLLCVGIVVMRRRMLR
ncbi:MAG: hypothetical protein ABSA96_19655 [Candidatus Acidiferrales bacterium]